MNNRICGVKEHKASQSEDRENKEEGGAGVQSSKTQGKGVQTLCCKVRNSSNLDRFCSRNFRGD